MTNGHFPNAEKPRAAYETEGSQSVYEVPCKARRNQSVGHISGRMYRKRSVSEAFLEGAPATWHQSFNGNSQQACNERERDD